MNRINTIKYRAEQKMLIAHVINTHTHNRSAWNRSKSLCEHSRKFFANNVIDRWKLWIGFRSLYCISLFLVSWEDEKPCAVCTSVDEGNKSVAMLQITTHLGYVKERCRIQLVEISTDRDLCNVPIFRRRRLSRLLLLHVTFRFTHFVLFFLCYAHNERLFRFQTTIQMQWFDCNS